MMLAAQYQRYKAQSVCASTPGEQIVLLFEHAAANLSKAISMIDNQDLCGAHNAIIRAQDIYLFLADQLDMHYEISVDLFTLYHHIYDELVQANLKKDTEILKRALNMTREFMVTWKKAEAMTHTAEAAR